MSFSAKVTDIWGDAVHVDREYDHVKHEPVVGLTVWEGDEHVTANLDREGVRKLRRALKRAMRDLPGAQ